MASHTARRSRNTRTGSALLARLLAPVRDFFAELTSSYHPERHYMRGGGTGGVA
jgi:hypothetical protein